MQRKYILSNRIDFISRIDVIDLILLKLYTKKHLLKEQLKFNYSIRIWITLMTKIVIFGG